MIECKGLFGKWFGHDFKKYLVKSKYIKPWSSNHELYGESVLEYYEMCRDKYEIRCKRCGIKANDNT